MKNILKTGVFFLVMIFPVYAQIETAESDFSINDPIWRQALGGSVLSTPHAQAESAVIAVDGGSVRAYSGAGTPMWFFPAGGRLSPFITRSREGTSYLSRTNGLLIAVNRAGRELWRRSTGSPLTAGIVIGWDGRLFVPADRRIFCYTASGNLLWTRVLDSAFSVVPKLDRNGGIIFALEDNLAYKIDLFGNIQTYSLSGATVELLSVEDNKILALYKDRSMEILEASTEWFFSAMSEISSSAVVLPRLPAVPAAAVNRGNNTAVVLEDGRIVFVSLDERQILWEGGTHIRELYGTGARAELEITMLFDERGIYVLSKDGASGFSIDGRRLWYILLENAAAIPAFGDDGVLYSGGNDWILYAYKVEDRIRTIRSGIYGPAPEGSYGLGIPHSIYLTNANLNEIETRNKLIQIEDAINTGRVGADEPAFTTFLLALSAERTHIQYRIKALQLLGQIGSRETISWLMDIFRRDSEPLIKAAAAAAVGAIGVDPDGIAVQTFLYTIIQMNGIKDEQVLLAIISATGALCRFSGPPLTEAGVRILNLLVESPNPASVRREANRELSSLR